MHTVIDLRPAMTPPHDPEREGYEACHSRVAPFRFITENPYDIGTVASEQWRGGWMRASDELRRGARK